MMKVRAIYNKDGTVSIIYPVLKSRRANETEKQWLERVFNRATPLGISYDDINIDQKPLPDRRFRSAWTKVGDRIEVDLVKAKAQVMAELRGVRDGELTRTDGLMARANEIGSQIDGNKLIQLRQRLRDLPQTVGIEAIKTVEELGDTYPGKLSVDEYLDLASV